MAVDLAGIPSCSGQAGAQANPPDQAQDVAALRHVFAAITAESCPRFFNFHMHTLCSDGRLSPEQLIKQAVTIGLEGLAITDHHSVTGYRQARQWLEAWQQANSSNQDSASGPHLWTGTEISAGLLEDDVHILAYAFDPDYPQLQLYLQGESTRGSEFYPAERVIEVIHQAGGLAVLAHPARYRCSHQTLIPAAVALGIDGVETYYAYGGNPSPWQPSPKETAEVEALSQAHNLLKTCGTDTHGLNLLQRI
jgi:predicted metal-dependent phosphoesterase TrpH